MAVLSHALLFIASLIASAAPIGVAHVPADTACLSSASTAPAAIPNGNVWLPASSEISVRARDVASVRVLGRCVVKAAPENAQPVLYVPFASQLDDSDDEDLAGAWAQYKPQFGNPAAPGVGPAALDEMRVSVGQLERPPRV